MSIPSLVAMRLLERIKNFIEKYFHSYEIYKALIWTKCVVLQIGCVQNLVIINVKLRPLLDLYIFLGKSVCPYGIYIAHLRTFTVFLLT